MMTMMTKTALNTKYISVQDDDDNDYDDDMSTMNTQCISVRDDDDNDDDDDDEYNEYPVHICSG